MKTLLIDNYDSFTYNLFQLISTIQLQAPDVLYNDDPALATLDFDAYSAIVISPGPGCPDQVDDFGYCKDIILNCTQPLLGICLGHQGIFSAFGGQISHAPEPIHGQASLITHNGDVLFQQIPNRFKAIRYHSLICTGPIPSDIQITAQTDAGLIMGIRHQHKPIWGIQYHPESILTEYGEQLLRNFFAMTVLPQASETPQRPQITSLEKFEPLISGALHLHLKQVPYTEAAASVFEHLFGQDEYAVWLDSSQIIPGFSRFSYMGAAQGSYGHRLRYQVATQTLHINHHATQRTLSMSIFDYVQHQMRALSVSTDTSVPFEFQGGFIGYWGYELNQETAPIQNALDSEHPDVQLLFIDRFLVFDHQQRVCYLAALDDKHEALNWLESLAKQWSTLAEPSASSLETNSVQIQGHWEQPEKQYLQDIRQCIDFIRDGNSYEVCLTNRFHIEQSCDPWQYYQRLRHISPAPHAAYLKLNQLSLACASMERFLFLDRERNLFAKPIKGTTARDAHPQQDQRQAQRLQTETKFLSEHLMIVDLLRNDLGRVCEMGTVDVPKFMQVESYTTVHQLVSTIQGKLAEGYDIVDCLRQVFPGGSMTGAPKIRTMQFINTLEKSARGVYSGCIGYLSLNGTADLNIVIRTAEISPNHIRIGAGGAIIALSDPEEEFQEMELKVKALCRAV